MGIELEPRSAEQETRSRPQPTDRVGSRARGRRSGGAKAAASVPSIRLAPDGEGGRVAVGGAAATGVPRAEPATAAPAASAALATGEAFASRGGLATGARPGSDADHDEPPASYGVDECGLIARSPQQLFVWFEATERGVARARRDLGDDGATATLTLRLFFAAWSGAGLADGGARAHLDHALDGMHGRLYVDGAQPGARVRAALGLVTSWGLFAPLAHSPELRVPHVAPDEREATEWMHVDPRDEGPPPARVAAPERLRGDSRALAPSGSSRAPSSFGGQRVVRPPRGEG